MRVNGFISCLVLKIFLVSNIKYFFVRYFSWLHVEYLFHWVLKSVSQSSQVLVSKMSPWTTWLEKWFIFHLEFAKPNREEMYVLKLSASGKCPAKLWLQNSFFLAVALSISLVHKHHSLMLPLSHCRTGSGLAESEASFLQGAGQRRLWGLAVEKEGCQGLLLPEMEEVLVCAEGQLLVLVHQWGGEDQCSF